SSSSSSPIHPKTIFYNHHHMDPYAAQPTSSTTPQIQQQQDPYYYMQPDYDQSQSQQQHYPYYPPQYDPYQQQPVEQQQYTQTEQYTQPEPDVPVHPPGVPVQQQPDPNAYYPQQQAYYQATEYTDPSYYAYPPPQPQQVTYSDPGQGQWQQYPGQGQWQQYPVQGDYGLTSAYPPNAQVGQQIGPAPHNGSVRGGGRGGGGSRGGGVARGGGRSARGGGGSSSFRGRGHGGVVRGGGRVGPRGGGRGTRPIVTQPKPQFLATCELCRVDCNTQEVLENHLNGKKHKKNVQIQEELRTLAAKSHATQMAATNVMIPDIKAESQTVQTEEQANGLKRKMIDGEKNSADEPNKKPKEVVPFICELCDVKCESAPVFDSHLKGRKHVYNFQRFQEQQAALGQVALQALYPALEAALYPLLLQALSQNAMASSSHGHGGLDQQVLQLLQPYLPQSGPNAFPPGPGFGPQGPNPDVTQEKPDNEPESKTEEAQVEPESKTEEDIMEPESKTDEDKVEPASKTQEDQVEPENQTGEEKVEPENQTQGDQVEPVCMAEEDQVEPGSKIEQDDSVAAEQTQ
nr:methyl-CpG-binding domain protein 2-like [Tanacetum cinerariifolium]